MENEFPPNSHARKDDRPKRAIEGPKSEKREVQPIATGRVVLRKKPLRKKFVEAFRPEDGAGFTEHLVLDVIVPGIKSSIASLTGGIADSATMAVEDALGIGRNRRRGGYTEYNRMSSSHRSRDDDRRPSRRETRPSDEDLREIIIESRVVANEVLDTMYEILSKYGSVSKRDLLGFLGEPHTYTDEDWGWTDLRGARVHSVREGYLLDLPRPRPLD